MENTNVVLVSYSNIDIIQSDIELSIEQYISTLPDKDRIYKNPLCFDGLLYYIYIHNLKPMLDKSKKDNKNHNDYILLDTVWNNIYKPVCFRFGYTVRILQFCTQLTNIDNTNIHDVKEGYYRTDGTRVNQNHTQIVRKWYKDSENSIQSNLFSNQAVPSMFLLKSKFQYRETDPIIPVQIQTIQQTPEQIAEKYKQAEKPPMIEID